MKIAVKVCRRLYWIWNDLLWLLPRQVRSFIIGHTKEKMNLTISVTTYIERFDECFKPTLSKLHELFPVDQIIVVANGHFDQLRQADYIKKLRAYCAQFPNVELFDFMQPVCISKMSNTSILNMQNKVRFSINEDVRISPMLRRFLQKSGILNEMFATINNSWCHTVSSREVFKQVGFLDERLPEMGGEDDDYAARCVLSGIEIKNYNTWRVVSSGKKTRKRDTLNSWGKDMRQQKSGYSDLNHDFLLNQKWETSNEPFDGATYVPNRKPKYWKLRPGMETPDFYQHNELK